MKNIKDQEHIHEKIIVEDDVWIGSNSTILKGTTLRKGTVIGALTKVDKSTEEYSVYSGNPMVKIKNRN